MNLAAHGTSNLEWSLELFVSKPRQGRYLFGKDIHGIGSLTISDIDLNKLFATNDTAVRPTTETKVLNKHSTDSAV